MPTQIIAIGGFESVAQRRAFDTYVFAQSRAPQNPAVGFIGTATGDAESSTLRFYAGVGPLPCRASHLSLFTRTPDLRRYLLSQDVIWVGGGNTKSMLAVWREWGLPELLREAWQAGIVLAGVSAGAICWFEQGVTDSWSDALYPLDCLGFLKGSCCPHYTLEADRRPSYSRMVAAGEVLPGYAVDDGAALHFVGDALHTVISACDGATAYRVSAGVDAPHERLAAVDIR